MVTERHTAQMLAHEKLVCSAILEINSQHGIYLQYPLTCLLYTSPSPRDY